MVQIIGSGMIAKSFSNYAFSKKCVLIASGVSNSLESSITAFQREEDLILNALARYSERQFIYFSTCSVFQLVKTPYINHKLKMEKLIAEKSASHLIFRLPQVVGVVKNSTLVSFLVSEMLNNRDMTIQLKARRNLIDVSDVARIVHHFIEGGKVANCIINIAAKKNVLVSDIVAEIAKIMNKNYCSTHLNSGESYEIPIDFLEMNLHRDEALFDDHYWKTVLMKNVPLIALEPKNQ